MNQVKWLLIFNYGIISTIDVQTMEADNEPPHNIKTYYLPVQSPINNMNTQYANCYGRGYVNPPHNCLLPPVHKENFHTVPEGNPLLDAFLLSTSLGLHPNLPGLNHNEHLPLNPYLALLLSHYGKYSPIFGKGRGLYGYNAVNNYHNNKPFGAYKIYEDTDS